MSDKMTQAELDAAKKLCEEATPGPWFVGEYDIHGEEHRPIAYPAFDETLFWCNDADRSLVEKSRDLVPRLLAHIAHLQSALDEKTREYNAAVADINEAAPCCICANNNDKCSDDCADGRENAFVYRVPKTLADAISAVGVTTIPNAGPEVGK